MIKKLIRYLETFYFKTNTLIRNMESPSIISRTY